MLEYVLGYGIIHSNRHFRIIGASSSLKDSKFYMATESLIPEIHSYFGSTREALSYFGILTSSCHHGIWKMSTRIDLVKDSKKGTGDGFGFVPESILKYYSYYF
jgi:hypothetical protein